jgi:hypothetical protein
LVANGVHVLKIVASPLLEECEDDTHISKMGTWESSGIVGVKTPCLEAFFISLKNYQSVDVENGLT